EAVCSVSEPIVLLLNNDVKLAPGCVDRLAETFERHADCFLASPLCWTFDGRYEGTRSALRFRLGLVHTELAPAEDVRGQRSEVRGQGSYTASAGAVLAVSRERFLGLSGFDPLFLPGRFEDLDLAFRAWLAGWRAYYVPEAVAYHKGSATFGARFNRRAAAELDARNALLFAWKNLREPRHMAIHLAFLMLRLARALATGETIFLRGWAGALRRLPQVFERRAAATPRVRSERELFDMLGGAA
ncbi:MAG: glycosyltransferase family 2 protein, partial [Planctomycetes bacterium]|nr:glycosyltransferase family 2 protein [Planctomycetota bacterium]